MLDLPSDCPVDPLGHAELASQAARDLMGHVQPAWPKATDAREQNPAMLDCFCILRSKLFMGKKSKEYSLTFRDSTFPVLQQRILESLPLDLINIISMTNIDHQYPPKIVGSFRYIVHEYPADIDLYEEFVGNSQKQTIDQCVRHFQQLARRIHASTKQIFLGDFKAGVDERYKIDIGNVLDHKHVHGYDSEKVKKAFLELHKKGLLTSSEVPKWLKYAVEKPTIYQHEELEELIRSKLVVRWSLEELIDGKKVLPGPGKPIITLESALTMKSIVKIDLWFYFQNRYIEITNWYNISFKNEIGLLEALTIKPEKYEDTLKKDLTYYHDPKLQKHMKFAKRMWLYGVLKNDKEFLIRLYPLFSSGAAKLYQICSDVETVEKMIGKHGANIPLEKVRTCIEDWKLRIGTLPENVISKHDSLKIFQVLDTILRAKVGTGMVQKLMSVHETLSKFVDRFVYKWLLKHKFIDRT